MKHSLKIEQQYLGLGLQGGYVVLSVEQSIPKDEVGL